LPSCKEINLMHPTDKKKYAIFILHYTRIVMVIIIIITIIIMPIF
jgi:hypothetical protein